MQYLWSNGNGDGLQSSSGWWDKGGHNRSGDCVLSDRNNLFTDRDCNRYPASYVCEKV